MSQLLSGLLGTLIWFISHSPENSAQIGPSMKNEVENAPKWISPFFNEVYSLSANDSGIEIVEP